MGSFSKQQVGIPFSFTDQFMLPNYFIYFLAINGVALCSHRTSYLVSRICASFFILSFVSKMKLSIGIVFELSFFFFHGKMMVLWSKEMRTLHRIQLKRSGHRVKKKVLSTWIQLINCFYRTCIQQKCFLLQGR